MKTNIQSTDNDKKENGDNISSKMQRESSVRILNDKTSTKEATVSFMYDAAKV